MSSGSCQRLNGRRSVLCVDEDDEWEPLFRVGTLKHGVTSWTDNKHWWISMHKQKLVSWRCVLSRKGKTQLGCNNRACPRYSAQCVLAGLDQVIGCEINFLNRQEDLTVYSIICDRLTPLEWPCDRDRTVHIIIISIVLLLLLLLLLANKGSVSGQHL